jgi:hypothetical protein
MGASIFLIALTCYLVYYRVYKPSGAIWSKRPADSNRPSIGRITVDSVPPPHTAASIMRYISTTEQLGNSAASQLFISTFNESPIGEEHVLILTGNHPGSTPEDPMAFVALPLTKRMQVTLTWCLLNFKLQTNYGAHSFSSLDRPRP